MIDVEETKIVDKTVKKITLRSSLTGKQASDHIWKPSSPYSVLFSGSRTVSWQLALPKSTLHSERGEGGEANVVEFRREI